MKPLGSYGDGWINNNGGSSMLGARFGFSIGPISIAGGFSFTPTLVVGLIGGSLHGICARRCIAGSRIGGHDAVARGAAKSRADSAGARGARLLAAGAVSLLPGCANASQLAGGIPYSTVSLWP